MSQAIADPAGATAESSEWLDPVAEYRKELSEALARPADGPDPHFEDAAPGTDEDVNGKVRSDGADIKPVISDGPSDAAIRAGEEDITEQQQQPNDGLPPDEVEIVVEEQPAQPTKPPQFRLRPQDKIEETALHLRKQNPDLSLKEAIAKAEAIHHVEAKEPAAPEPELPEVTALMQERRDLEREIRRLGREFAPEDEIQEKEKRLDEIADIIPKAEEQAKARALREATAYQQSAERVTQLYPDATNPESPLYKRMEEIHADMERGGDPTIHNVNKPLIIAQMAAAELRIAPKPKAGTTPQVARTGSRGIASMTAPLNASPRSETPPPTARILQRLETVSSPEDFDSLIRGMR